MTNARDKANIPVLNFQSKGIDDNADATAITINSSENVLINTTSASGFDAGGLPLLVGNGSTHQGLTIYTGTSHTGAIHFADGTGAGSYRGQINYRHDTDALQIAVAGSEKMRLTSTGLGIGTSSPLRDLVVSNSGAEGYEFGPGESSDLNQTLHYNRSSSVYVGNSQRASYHRFDTATTEAMRLTSTGLGIGETAPLGKLHVKTADSGASANSNGDDLIVENSSNTGISILSGNSNFGLLIFGDDGDDNIGRIQYQHSDNSMHFFTNANERMRITNAGKVGIGESDPHGRVHIKDGNSGDTAIDINNDDLVIENSSYAGITLTTPNNKGGGIYFSDPDVAASGRLFYDHAGNFMTFTTNNSERMRINSSGNVGIGTSSSSSTLHISGNPQVQLTQPNNLVLQNDTDSATSGDAKTGILFRANYSGSTPTDLANITAGKENATNNNYGSFISFHTRTNGVNELAERMRISSNGAVGINSTATTLPLGAARFIVQGGHTTEYFGIDQYGVGTYRKVGTGTQYAVEFRNDNGVIGRISVDGSTTTYATSSDYRLKENVSYDFDATTRLKQLKPARFNFIADTDTTVDGFLAHEVQSVIPEAITGTKDAVNKDGTPEYQGIDQSKLVPLLVKTIQELEARITALETNQP